MKTKLLIAVLAGFTFTACTNNLSSISLSAESAAKRTSFEQATPEKQKAFMTALKKVASEIPSNSKYRKLPHKTEADKVWFKNQMFQLWSRQISRPQFISEGIAKYPDRKYEFEFIANGYQKYS